MHKKKLPNENKSDKHSSELNLQSKLIHPIEYAEKAIQHDNEPNQIPEKDCKPPAIPKTKFTTKKSHESFSSSSSRIKNFPAEEIRRLQPPPRPEIISKELNDGQGDGFLQSLYSESLKLPEVSNFYHKSDGQIHRPFVPTARGSNIQEPHSVPVNHFDKFPVSNHRIEQRELLGSNNQSNFQAVSNFNNIQSHSQYKNPQNIVYKIPPQLSAHQFEPEYGQTINYGASTHGMTSPQDLMINQLKISQSNPVQNPNNYPTPQQYEKLENKLEDKTSQLEYSEYPPRRSERSQDKETKKKVIQFTPAMKHDQELLISKLKQQGISEEIIKRQFDALLTEQKRQLNYLQQLVEPELVEKSNKIVRRKISRNSEDGKPEWMAHITPPRITFANAEKFKSIESPVKEQKKVGFDSKVDVNRDSEQTIQYWQANDRQNGMYVNCRNGISSHQNHQCNCHQQKIVHQNYPVEKIPVYSGQYQQYPEINPLGNGYFILYDPNYQNRNNQQVTTLPYNHHHHLYHYPSPHECYNQQNGVGIQQNLINNSSLKPLNQPLSYEMPRNLQEINLKEKQRVPEEEILNSVKNSQCGNVGKNGRNNGLQDV